METPPPRSAKWHLTPSASAHLNREPDSYLPSSTVEVTVPIATKAQKCPFKKSTKVAWTEEQRAIAKLAPVMQSVPDLVSETENVYRSDLTSDI